MSTQIDFEQARLNMIEQQIRPWEVLDQKILGLLNEVHREDFVEDSHKELALADLNIPLAHEQVMMTPKMEARLLQALAPKSSDSALEIGTGSAYLTALLAKSTASVESIDIYPDFIDQAGAKLKNYGLENVSLGAKDFFTDWQANGQYDLIAVTGSLPTLDPALQEHLTVGGRLFVIVGEAPVMEALLITRVGETDWSREVVLETELPALVGVSIPSTFEL